MRTANLTNNTKIHKYVLVNNELQLKPMNKEILVLPKNFFEQVFNEFIKRGLLILRMDRNMLRTERTLLILSEDYVLKVTSSHIEELLIV